MSSCLERNSARRRAGLLLLLTLGASAVAGCASQQPAAALADTPMEIDPAMRRRDWEGSAAWYPNGDTLAGVQRFPLRPEGGAPGTPDYPNALFDVAASMAQTVALPFTYLIVPPFAPQVYTGENIPPTHTGMPPMAPPAREGVYGQVQVGREEELRRLESPQPLPPPQPTRERRDPRRGPLGPGDTEFMSSPPTPEEPD